MKKADVYEALGLEVPSEKPAVATPGSAEDPKGGQGQEVAAPAVREENTTALDEGRGTETTVPEEQTREDRTAASAEQQNPASAAKEAEANSGNTEMSKEERARQARLRREREQQAAVDAAVEKATREAQEKAEQEFSAMLKELGLTNRYRDNALITNRQEYLQWQEDAKDEKISQQLRSGKLTQEGLRQVVQASPEVQELKAQVARLQQQAIAQQRKEADRQIQRELEEIRQLDPNVKSIKDVLDLPTGQEFSRLVQERGMTFTEAFRLANAERLQQVQQRAAEEQQARSYHSKDHLVGVGSNSRTPVTIPLQTYNAYRMLRPELTDEEIRQDYAKRHKK